MHTRSRCQASHRFSMPSRHFVSPRVSRGTSRRGRPPAPPLSPSFLPPSGVAAQTEPFASFIRAAPDGGGASGGAPGTTTNKTPGGVRNIRDGISRQRSERKVLGQRPMCLIIHGRNHNLMPGISLLEFVPTPVPSVVPITCHQRPRAKRRKKKIMRTITVLGYLPL